MKLDRETYEAWLLDRMEGRLSPAHAEELDAFLRANPDLPASMVDLPGIDGGDLEFPTKGALRRDHPPTGAPDITRLDDFLVARWEKELCAEQEKQLDRFLYEHPEAERQAALMALAHVPKDPIAFAAKATIERHFPPTGSPDAYRLTDFLVAALERDLAADQRSALKQYLAEHPEAAHEKRLVAATRIVPVAMRFTGKKDLRKREVLVVALWPRLAAAACFLLLMGAGWWLLREKPAAGQEIARIEKPVAHQEIRIPDRDAQPVAPERPDATENHGAAPEASQSARGERKAEGLGTTKVKARPTAPRPAPLPEQKPVLQNTPATKSIAGDLPSEKPALAQQVEEPTMVPAAPELVVNVTAPQEKQEVPTSIGRDGSSQDLGAYVANAIRGKVLVTPQRKAVLDGSDALAFADKAISAVTGGQGGVEVQHTSASRGFQLRLGRNFSVSTSRGQ